jgi:hypothetical protein
MTDVNRCTSIISIVAMLFVGAAVCWADPLSPAAELLQAANAKNDASQDSTSYGVPDVQTYLREICDYAELSYVDLSSSDIDVDNPLSKLNKCGVVFVVLPTEDLTAEHVDALAEWADRPLRRLVLAGDHTGVGIPYNVRLNSLLGLLGVQMRYHPLDPERPNEDPSIDGYYCEPSSSSGCPVNSQSPLMNGVTALWYNLTGVFYMGPTTTALAYCPQESQLAGLPWLAEETTAGGGSVVCSHDTNVFGGLDGLFDLTYDVIEPYAPNRNFKFITNLCTVFPE